MALRSELEVTRQRLTRHRTALLDLEDKYRRATAAKQELISQLEVRVKELEKEENK